MFYTSEMISDLNLPIDKIFNFNSLISFNHFYYTEINPLFVNIPNGHHLGSLCK
jgi:hypothetical protein